MRLQQQFRRATKLIKNYPDRPLHGRHPYPTERDIVILYGLWNGWSAGSISHRGAGLAEASNRDRWPSSFST